MRFVARPLTRDGPGKQAPSDGLRAPVLTLTAERFFSPSAGRTLWGICLEMM